LLLQQPTAEEAESESHRHCREEEWLPKKRAAQNPDEQPENGVNKQPATRSLDKVNQRFSAEGGWRRCVVQIILEATSSD